MYKKSKRVALLVILLIFVSHINAEQVDFVGSKTCQSCHEAEFSAWEASDHYKSMQIPTDESVLGDFNNVEVEFHNIKTRFFKTDNKFYVETTDSKGKRAIFTVDYTFGYFPLQQYLLNIGDGKLQAFNIAWDSRSEKEGGQHWYHLQPTENITPKHPFFWQRHFQNWNGRCAECHSTNLQKNFDLTTNSYNTTYSEINVACESCHGPGQRHIELANAKQLDKSNSGFTQSLPTQNLWSFNPGKTIAESHGKPLDTEIDMCGKCHSLRSPLTDESNKGGFFDKYRIEWVREPLYHQNGLIKEEVFVLGSFLQSKMYQAGVTCSNCHNAHSGKVKIEGNGLCLQCHQASTFNSPDHHRHEQGSEGSMCINCHMPDKVYMGVDGRRDHSFSIPTFQFSSDPEEPNACLACHEKEDAFWVAEAKNKWQKAKVKDWDRVHKLIVSGDAKVDQAIKTYLEKGYTQGGDSAIRKASMLLESSKQPSQASVELTIKQLSNSDSLIRRGAVEALEVLHPADRWQVLKNSLGESNPIVRFSIARVLVDALPIMTQQERLILKDLLVEYRYMLGLNADSPITQMNLASLEFNLGNLKSAEQGYLNAIEIERSYIPSFLQIADFYRQVKRDEEGRQYLQEALTIDANNPDVNHSLGLFYIRQKDYQKALVYLRNAYESPESQFIHAYVYAIALDNQMHTNTAINVLKTSLSRWPANKELSQLLASYENKNKVRR
ncbi:MAG: hypothetical protein NWQ54_16585 [Paraglaciecola sp.]|nr:hypothetical protein [Paraglaciecola sp.]